MKIIVADDDPTFLDSTETLLKCQDRISIKVFKAACGNEVYRILRNEPDIECIVLDYDFSNSNVDDRQNGFEIAGGCKKIAPLVPIIMTSIREDRGEFGMWAEKNKIDFLDKPSIDEKLIVKLEDLLNNEKKSESLFYKKAVAELSRAGFESNSESMKPIIRQIYLSAKGTGDILILGETGSGKTTLAKIIHKISPRSSKIFNDFSCGAFSPELIESELFGHVKGAFSGAVTNKRGILDIIGAGTLFLDELAELSVEKQRQLLYVFGRQKKYHSVGADPEDSKKIEARIIAATLKIPTEDNVRKDLFERFQYVITLPPLRERREDIPIFVSSIMHNYLKKHNKYVSVNEGALKVLYVQPWLGNLHQLTRVLEKVTDAVMLEGKQEILKEDVIDVLKVEYGLQTNSYNEKLWEISKYMIDNKETFFYDHGIGETNGLREMVKSFEKELIREVLNRCKNPLAGSRFIAEEREAFRVRAEKYGLIDNKK